MKTKIYLHNIQLFGMHGVNRIERENGQLFQIDLEIEANLTNAIKTDDINETLDYCALYDEIQRIFKSKKYNLIETLAGDIVKSLMDIYKILSCRVKIRKPNVLINGILDTVEVEVIDHV